MPRLTMEQLRPYETARAGRTGASASPQLSVSTTARMRPRDASVHALYCETRALVEASAEQTALVRALAEALQEARIDALAASEMAVALADERDLLQLHLAHRDDLLASMHAHAALLEERLERASGHLRRRAAVFGVAAPARVPCLCCFEEKAVAEGLLTCTAGHAFCRACVNAAAGAERKRPGRAPAAALSCFHVGGCDGELRDLAALDEGAKMLADHYVHAAASHVARALNLDDADPRCVRLAHLRADGSYRALACAACGFGPLGHAHCDELLSHHGQRLDGAAAISNACPRCGALAAHVDALREWEGAV